MEAEDKGIPMNEPDIETSLRSEIKKLKVHLGLRGVDRISQLPQKEQEAWRRLLRATAEFVFTEGEDLGVVINNLGDVANELLEMAEGLRGLEDSKELGTLIMLQLLFKQTAEELGKN